MAMPQRHNASHDGKTTQRRDDGRVAAAAASSRAGAYEHEQERLGESFFLIYIFF
jgi:hypothetical protein